MKKIKGVIALLIMGSLLLTACGGEKGGDNQSTETKTDGSTTQEGTAQAAEGDKVKITVWAWDVALLQLQDNANQFVQTHPNVEFVFEDMGTDQIYSKLVTSLATGVGLPDVVAIEGERMSGFGSKFPDNFLDLSQVVEKDKHLPIKISEVMVNDRILAYPWDAAPMGMFYRRDAFEAAGVVADQIVTWDDYIAAGKAVQEKTEFKMMPLAESTRDTFYRLLLSELGSFYFNQAGELQMNSEPSIEAMTMVKKIYDAGITTDYNGWDEYVQLIATEKVATVPEAVWMIGSIKDESPDSKGKWGVIPLPKFTPDGKSGATNGGSVLAIPAVTKNPEIVTEYVRFAMTDETSLIDGFTKYGLYPSYKPVYSNSIFTEGDEFFDGQKVYEIFNKYGQEIPMVNYTSYFAEVSDANKNAVAKILLKNEDIQQTMDNLQAELEAKIK